MCCLLPKRRIPSSAPGSQLDGILVMDRVWMPKSNLVGGFNQPIWKNMRKSKLGIMKPQGKG